MKRGLVTFSGRHLSLIVTVAAAAVPSILVLQFVEPLWVSDAYWRVWGRLRDLIPLNAPIYPLLMRIFQTGLGLTDLSVTIVMAIQHALYVSGLIYAALYFQRLRERLIFILLMTYPNYALWMVNSFLKEAVAAGFLNFSIGAVLRLTAQTKWKRRDAVVYFLSFLGSALTVYPYAILLSVLPLIYMFRYVDDRDRRVARSFGASVGLGVAVAVSAQFVVAAFNVALGHSPFHSTAGLIGAYKIQNFHVDEPVRERLVNAVLAKTDDPVLREVVPIMMDPRVMSVGKGEEKKATMRMMQEKFGRKISYEEAEVLLGDVYTLTLRTREYWTLVWTPRGIFQYFLYVETVFYLFEHANDQIQRVMSRLEPELVEMMGENELSSLTREAYQRNLETQFSFIVKCYDFHVLRTVTPFIIADQDDDYTFRTIVLIVVPIVLFGLLFWSVHNDYRRGLASIHLAMVGGALIYVLIMGTIHFHTPRYGLPPWTLFFTTWALQAAVIDWPAMARSLVRSIGNFGAGDQDE